jgi:hypothetical protein
MPFLIGATTTACGGQGTNTTGGPGEDSSAFVGAPVEGVQQTAGPLPQLANFPANAEAGYMSTWVELNDAAPSTMNADWVRKAAGDGFTTPPALPTQLSAARDQADKIAEKARVQVPKGISEIAGLFDYYTPMSGTKQLVGYEPERARWLMSRSAGGENKTFDDPYAFAEMRQRGARLYCAATAAYNHRTRANRVMGKTMAAGVSVFGLPLDLTVVEPTLSMGRPMRFDSGKADGAHGFVVPFEAGVRMRPVSFLFGLPELKIPVSFVTADSELASRANVQGNNFEKWMTMSHMDGFASVSQPYLDTSLPEIPLLEMGIFSLSAKIKLDMGAAACSEGANYPSCRASALANPSRLIASTTDANGTVAWRPRSGGWTTPGQTGPFSYNNAAWDVDTANWLARPRGADSPIATRLPDPLAMRMLQNNDKSLEVHTSSGVTMELIAAGGGKIFDWLEAYIDAHGSIRAGVDMVHRFREQEEMVMAPPPDPNAEFAMPYPMMVTSFSVTPASTKEFTFGLGLGFTIGLDLPFLKRKFTKEWNPISKTLSTGLTEWSEERRLRMDTAISDGANANFNVGSHWPRDASFPTYEAIDGCQAPQTEVTQPEAPCAPANQDKPKPADFKPIKGNICLWREEFTVGPDDVGAGSAGDLCWRAMQPWMERGVYQRQLWHESQIPGSYIHARAMPFDDKTELNALHDVLVQCDALYAKENATAQFGDLIHFQPCDLNAKLVDDIIAPMWTDDTAPAPGAAGEPDSCD